jgi:hypothetical protein
MMLICSECGVKYPSEWRTVCCSAKCKTVRIGKIRMKHVLERFWSNVHKTDWCWEWTGSKIGSGYGQLRAFDRTRWTAHRLSWYLNIGPIPDGKWVLHDCDNPPCVRPDHLFLGDHDANVADKVGKHRQARGEMCRKALKPEDVVRIRELIPVKSLTEIGAMFNITKQSVWAIREGITWKHLI